MGKHTDDDGDGIADFAQLGGEAAADDETHHALRTLSYHHSDPVKDDAFPGITALDGDADDAFPPDWGTEPTERDAAAISAGNA